MHSPYAQVKPKPCFTAYSFGLNFLSDLAEMEGENKVF